MNKISEAVLILKQLGLPKDQQNERSGLTLLTLAALKENTPWTKSKKRNIRIHDILSLCKITTTNITLKIPAKPLGVRPFINSNKPESL